MNGKKYLLLMLLTVLAMAMLLPAGCGGKPKAGPSGRGEAGSAAGAAGEKGLGVSNITILGGNPGGPMGVMCEGFAETIRRTYRNVNVTVQPGGDGPNEVRVAQGEVQFGGGYGATVYAAYKGQPPYDKSFPNLRTVVALNNKAAFQFLIREDTGITSFEEIKDKRFPLKVTVNKQGSMMEVAGREVLKAYGISYDDINRWGGKIYYEAFNTSVEMIKSGTLDAIVGIPEYPASAYLEVGNSVPVRILPLRDDIIDSVSRKLGARKGIVPAGTYPFLKQDLPTFVTSLVMVTSEGQPEDLVYGVVKAFYQNLAYYKSTYGSVNDYKPEDMVVYQQIPFHKGAEKFYKEIGLLK